MTRLMVILGLAQSATDAAFGLRDWALGIGAKYGMDVTINAYEDDISSVFESLPRDQSLITVQYSYGNAAGVRAARNTTRVVDLMLMLEPVPNWGWGQYQKDEWHLPGNVRRACCWYVPGTVVLNGDEVQSCPIVNTADNADYVNCPVPGLDHFSVPADTGIRAEMEKLIAALVGNSGATNAD